MPGDFEIALPYELMADGNDSQMEVEDIYSTCVKDIEVPENDLSQIDSQIGAVQKRIEDFMEQIQNCGSTESEKQSKLLDVLKLFIEQENKLIGVKSKLCDLKRELLLKNVSGDVPPSKRYRLDEGHRVVRITRSDNVSSLAKGEKCLNDVCEDQPIYVHWFGPEMLRAYESAKLQVSESSPIKIELDGCTYEIERNSLKVVTDAIRVATSLLKDKKETPCRGFKGCANIRHTELAMTCLVSRALDRFIFPDPAIGACLHRAPCRKLRNNPEKPDIYIAPFENKDFYPGEPAVLSDWKLHREQFYIADRESALYSGVGAEEGCSDKFPVLIGIPGTPDYMDLQLHVNVDRKFWKLVIASGCPSDPALLCTLKVGIDHLIKKNFFTTNRPCSHPVPFKEMDQYSILGEGERVFFNTLANTVYKFFDTKHDDFFHPSILHDLIGQVPVLPDIKLTPSYSEDVRLYTLTYKHVNGTVNNTSNELKSFVGVAQVLSEMHNRGFVHGDVRLDNIIFSDDQSHLIDFDFVGRNSETSYHGNYNSRLPERHTMAIGGNRMTFEHDRFSLAKIIEDSCVTSFAAKDIISKLHDPLCDLGEIAKQLEES